MKMIAQVLGSNNFEDWEGKQIALYEADERKADDGKAIRVRPYKPKVETAFCEDCGQEIKPTADFSVNKIVKRSQALFGADLCIDCAKKRKEAGGGKE
jgi:RNA polymerase-binding transcription factor DksA